MDKPLVSILIPVFNREKKVCRAIDSALAQTYKNFEIIISDNASTDNTWTVLQFYAQRYSCIRIFRNESNVGPVRNWKCCLQHARGEYVKFLWSDDTIEPLFLDTLMGPLIQDEDVGFAYSSMNIVLDDSRNNVHCVLDETKRYNTLFFITSLYYGLNDVPVSPGCAIFRKKDVNKYLVTNIKNPYGMDFSRFGAGNDVLLFLEACSSYKYFYYSNAPLATFYGGKDSFSIANDLSKYYKLAFIHFILKHWKYRGIRRQYCQQFEMDVEFKKFIPMWHVLDRKIHWRAKRVIDCFY